MEALALAALGAALTLPGARLELVALRPSVAAGCAVVAFDAPRPVGASGDFPLRARGVAAGAPCDGWAWARVRLSAETLVAARDIAAGEPLDASSCDVAEREVHPARPPLSRVPVGATAARAIPAGTAIEEVHLRLGPPPGDRVVVLLRVGDLAVEHPARAVACSRGRACALLPSGRRVEGSWDGARLVVEAP